MKLFSMKNIMLGLIAIGLLACAGAAKKYEKGVIPQAYRPKGNEIAKTKNLLQKEFAKGKVRLSQVGPDYHRVNNIIKRLSRAAGLGNFSYPVYIADAGTQVNAMAVQNNSIVVYKQLLRNIRSDDMLSVVLGHEIAHILNRHGHDNVARNRSAAVSVGAQILGAIVAAKTGSGRIGAAARDVSGTIGVGAYVRPYDRSMELEADHDGMLLMAKAGYSPSNAISFWNNSKKYLGTSRKGNFLDTHPDPGNRRQNLIDSLPYAKKYYRK